jgi:RES domain-containing protein
MEAWRIVDAAYAAGAFRGDGARRFGGRWNSKGVPVVYTAQSRALAALELLVHLEADAMLRHYRLIGVAFEEAMVKRLDMARLPANWKRAGARRSLRELGDRWVASRESLVLQVPSALIPGECNFLLNVLHSDFPKLVIGRPETFRFDSRFR